VIEMPVTLPTAQDVRRARKQATTVVAGALEQARTPLYAAIGAGNLATAAVTDAVRKARGGTNQQADSAAQTAQARVAELQTRLAELQVRLTDLPARLRTRLDNLSTELTELRGKLEPAELRELADGYRKAMQELYARLSVRGEKVYGEFAAQPGVKRAVSRVEAAADTAEVRVEKFVEDARAVADEVLGRVTKRTRSTGEKAARATKNASTVVAEAVEDAGDEVAHSTRSVTRKAANRTEPATAKSTAQPKAQSTAQPAKRTTRSTSTTKPAATRRRSDTTK